jgi:acetyl esterase/lipase
MFARRPLRMRRRRRILRPMRSFLVRQVLSLPPRWLVALSGGKPVTIAGRTLDPRVQFMAAQAKSRPGLHTMDVAAARKASADGLRLLDAPAHDGVEIEDREIPGSSERQKLRVRIYRPVKPERLTPVLVYFHMGGVVIGDLETCHHFSSLMTAETGCLTVSVDYRLAPEHKFPAAVDDAVTAFRWARDNARSLGGNVERVAIGGDSAGGMLAAVVSQEMLRVRERGPVLQVLIYPAVNWTAAGGSMEDYAEAFPLNTPMMTWFRNHYLNSESEATDVRVSPGLARDLHGLPPALIFTAGHDPLVDQGRDYATALKTQNVPVLYRCFDPLPHGFTAMSGAIPAAAAANLEIAQEIRRTLG